MPHRDVYATRVRLVHHSVPCRIDDLLMPFAQSRQPTSDQILAGYAPACPNAVPHSPALKVPPRVIWQLCRWLCRRPATSAAANCSSVEGLRQWSPDQPPR